MITLKIYQNMKSSIRMWTSSSVLSVYSKVVLCVSRVSSKKLQITREDSPRTSALFSDIRYWFIPYALWDIPSHSLTHSNYEWAEKLAALSTKDESGLWTGLCWDVNNSSTAAVEVPANEGSGRQLVATAAEQRRDASARVIFLRGSRDDVERTALCCNAGV